MNLILWFLLCCIWGYMGGVIAGRLGLHWIFLIFWVAFISLLGYFLHIYQ